MKPKTIAQINERIRQGRVVVLTAAEMVTLVREVGPAQAAQEVDVVTTGTFSPLCSCGLFFTFPQSRPRIKAHRAWLNGVPAYCGLTASEIFLGSGQPVENDPLNQIYPGEFRYGGGHVIEDLAKGENVSLRVMGYGQACHPKTQLELHMNLAEIESATLIVPSGGWVNFPCGVNVSDTTIYTVLGTLKPRLGNANFCSAGALSPLLKDPRLRLIGAGLRVFLGGGPGLVAGRGLRFKPDLERDEIGLPTGLGRSMMLVGSLKEMSPRFVVGISYQGYGCAIALGIGVPLPILDEQAALEAGRGDEELHLKIMDMANDFPANSTRDLGRASLAGLFSGTIEVQDQKVQAVPLSSRSRAEEICRILQKWIAQEGFELGLPFRGLEDYGH